PIIAVNVDWARIQCCNHARASDCRSSCVQLYSGIISSSSWQTLQLDCIHRPSESSLITCLNDVSSPCKLGCSGLHFCSNFNNRYGNYTLNYRALPGELPRYSHSDAHRCNSLL
ncbi:Reversion-inducing cysteine-rich protein with Kazal motifs, partial [Geodia barretti]